MSIASLQAARACTFWTGLEYMQLATVPDADEKRVFRVRAPAEMPWTHPTRARRLGGSAKQYKGQVAYCAPFSKRDFTVELRSLVGAPPVDPSALRIKGQASCLLIPLDSTGRVCGEPFVSSLPWLMARLTAHIAAGKNPDELDLSGFDEYSEALMTALNELMVQLMLIPKEADQAAPQAEAADDKHRAKPAAQTASAASTKPAKSAAATPWGSDGKLVGPADMKPLELEHVQQLLQLIWDRAGWQPPAAATDAEPLRIGIVTLRPFVDKSIDMKAMNSFVAADVWRVRNVLTAGKPVGPALSAYLELIQRPSPIDLRKPGPDGGLQHFVDMLSPDKLPAGCWPDFPLVSAQQFAVNMAREHLREGGLYGVNGPPGTGKSTLLRDVIADKLVQRAVAFASFSSPEDAFLQELKPEGHQFGYHKVHPQLSRLGIVIASSNNGAVENVIKDLPKVSKPMANSEASYFREVAESVATGQLPKNAPQERAVGSAWGLIAALMGNRQNRRAFLRRFWFDVPMNPDTAIAPNPLRHLPGIIKDGTHGALPWGDATAQFNAALKAAQQRAHDVSATIRLHKELKSHHAAIAALTAQLRDAGEKLQTLSTEDSQAAEAHEAATRRRAACAASLALDALVAAAEQALSAAATAAAAMPTQTAAQDGLQAAIDDAAAAAQPLAALASARPGLWERLFNWGATSDWRKRLNAAADTNDAAQEAVRVARLQYKQVTQAHNQQMSCNAALHAATADRTRQAGENRILGLSARLTSSDEESLASIATATHAARERARGELAGHQAVVKALEWQLNKAQTQLASTEVEWARLAALHQELGAAFYEKCDLLDCDDEALQLLVAYQDEALRTLRIKVFVAAMRLNESFVVAAWPKLRSNLAVFVDFMSGKISQAQLGEGSVDLWNSFFVAVPVVSSTFASVSNLFEGLGHEQIGLLLIDEAGQSTPQNALGAVWRSRSVLAVGDPIQLEPVVPLPPEALNAWREWTKADRKWAPPACSTQTLADQMTPYGTTLKPGEKPPVWVGSPLRVHRRCLNPMFDVANKIAYGKLMVNGVADTTGNDDWLGHSCWFDVTGQAEGHWVDAQGEFVMNLVRDLLATQQLAGALQNDNGEWHINVITPYKEVADQFGRKLREHFPDVEGINRMAGTVHTFQGKEAEVVILLLGGNPDKEGAVSFFAGNEQAPNLLNVALTRAKRRIYVVGDFALWTENSGTFRELADQLTAHRSKRLAAAKAQPETT